MKILILGGSRFIGYLTMCRLLNDGHDVTIFNRQITVPPEPFPKRVRFITGNRTTKDSLASIFLETTFDVLIDISGYTKKDVEYVLEHCANKIGHYIFISSSTVYDSPISYRVFENSPKISGLILLQHRKSMQKMYLLVTDSGTICASQFYAHMEYSAVLIHVKAVRYSIVYIVGYLSLDVEVKLHG